MPYGSSQKNPPWARDELILALDLYMHHRPALPGDNDEGVVELSDILNALPIHTDRPDLESFRNPNGVAMKLANFAALDPQYPGSGLTGGGKADAQVWDDFQNDQEELATLAANIRSEAVEGTAPVGYEEDEEEVPEGRILFRTHRAYERNSTLARKKKAAVLKSTGKLSCEVCRFDFADSYGPELGKGFIEAHHLVPLSEINGPVKSTMKDLALVCSNCHRMIHRSKPWLQPPQLKEHLNPQ